VWYNIYNKEREVKPMLIKVSNLDCNLFYNTPVGEWLDCLFDADGEEVLVELRRGLGETELEFVSRCFAVLIEAGFDEDEIDFLEIVDAITAEAWGLDTY
jgi:hypothetical protein